MTTQYGVTPSGFVPKPESVILAEYQASWIANVDATADLSPTTPEGKIIAMVVANDVQLWALAEQAWNSYDRGSVQGAGLDNLGDLGGDPREGASYTQVYCALGFSDLSQAPFAPGSLVANVVGNSALTFSNVAEVTAAMVDPISGVAQGILFQATTIGATPPIAPAALTVITSPVTGWTSIINVDAQTQLGTNEETDPAYVIRQEEEIANEGGNSANATAAALIALGAAQSPPITIAAQVLENYTDAPVTAGSLTLPPHSFSAIVYDPTGTLTSAQIGQVVWANKPPGIRTVGNTSVTITDPNLGDQVVSYITPTPVPLYILAVVVLRPGFTIGTVGPAIQSALVAAALAPTPPGGTAPPGQLLPGTPVVQSQLRAVVSNVPGVFDVQLLFFSTTAGVFNVAPLPIDPTEIATISSDKVFVQTGSYP